MLSRYASNNDLKMMKNLLDKDQVRTTELQEAMLMASSNGHIEAIDMLVSHGADLNEEPFATDYRDFTPLSIAANFGQVEVVQYLILKGADVNYAPRSTGTMPIAVAIDFEGDTASQDNDVPRMECSKILLAAGANPFTSDQKGRNAADLAKRYNFAEATEAFNKHRDAQNED